MRLQHNYKWGKRKDGKVLSSNFCFLSFALPRQCEARLKIAVSGNHLLAEL